MQLLNPIVAWDKLHTINSCIWQYVCEQYICYEIIFYTFILFYKGCPCWHMFICEGQLYGVIWHSNIISIFVIINKLIISWPSIKMWIRFWHVSICEGQLCRLSVVWKSFLKPACPLACRPLSSTQLLNRASRIMANTLANTGPTVIPL